MLESASRSALIFDRVILNLICEWVWSFLVWGFPELFRRWFENTLTAEETFWRIIWNYIAARTRKMSLLYIQIDRIYCVRRSSWVEPDLFLLKSWGLECFWKTVLSRSRDNLQRDQILFKSFWRRDKSIPKS